MEGSDSTLEELIASVERGLLITHFWYIRGVNQQTLQQTGLTRDGVFLIENGKITTPVMNFRFLESPGAAAEEHEAAGTGGARARVGRRHDDRPALVATDFPLPSISDAI